MPFDPLSTSAAIDGVTSEEIVAIALSNVGIEWTLDGCTAFVWGVSNLAGAPFFDLQDWTVAGNPRQIQDREEGFVVPHSPGIVSSTDNVAGDGWAPAFAGTSASDMRASLQPGDVVRVYAAGNASEVSGSAGSGYVAHSFIVVSIDGGNVQVVDNWNTPGIIQHSLADIEAVFAPSGQYQSAFVSRLDEDYAAENFDPAIAGNGFGDFSGLVGSPIATEAYTLLEDFNDNEANSAPWSYINDVSEEDGVLKLTQSATDVQNYAFLDFGDGLTNAEIAFDGFFHSGTNNYLAGATFRFTGQDGQSLQAQFVMQRSSWSAHNSFDSANYDKPALYFRQQADAPRTIIYASDLSTTALLDDWTRIETEFNGDDGKFSVDVNSDGVIDLEFQSDDYIGASLDTVIFNPYGWFTGHYLHIDNLSVVGEAIVTEQSVNQRPELINLIPADTELLFEREENNSAFYQMDLLETFSAGSARSLGELFQLSDPDGIGDITRVTFSGWNVSPFSFLVDGTIINANLVSFSFDEVSSFTISDMLDAVSFQVPTEAENLSLSIELEDRSGHLSGYRVLFDVEAQANGSPTIIDPNLITVQAGTTGVIYDLVATDDVDTEGAGLTFSLLTSSDRNLFDIDPVTGQVSYIVPTGIADDADANGDGIYELSVQVEDSEGHTTSQSLQISVEPTVVDEKPPVPNHILEYFSKETAYADESGLNVLLNVGDSRNDVPLLQGWTVSEVFEFDTFRAVALEHPDFAPVLAVRGSTGIPGIGDDWFENFRPNGVGYDEFRDALENTTLELWLSDPQNAGAVITGHSQGGAIAQYAAIEAIKLGNTPSQLVTFNTAGIPNEALSEVAFSDFDPVSVEHFVSHGDIVSFTGNTLVPTPDANFNYYDFEIDESIGVFHTHYNHWFHDELNSAVTDDLHRSTDGVDYPDVSVRLVNGAPTLAEFLRPDFSLLAPVGDGDDDFAMFVQPLTEFLRSGFDDLNPAIAILENANLSLPNFAPALPLLRGLSDAINPLTNEALDTGGEAIADLIEGGLFERSNLEGLRGSLAFAVFSYFEIVRDLDNLAREIGFVGSELILDARDFSSEVISGFLRTTIEIGNLLLSAVEEIADVGTGLLDTISGFLDDIGFQSQVTGPIVAVDDQFIRKDVFGVEDAIFLARQPEAVIDLEAGKNVIVGSVTSLDGSIVRDFGVDDAIFVAAVQIAQDELGKREGSAILTLDEDDDGIDELEITLQGDFRLESFETEIVDGGTIIRYLGNALPEATTDAFETSESAAFTTGNVLLNDTDGDDDQLSVVGLDDTGTLGVVTDNGDGTFDYDPSGAFDSLIEGEVATDTFVYLVSDGTETVSSEVTIAITGEGSFEPILNPVTGTTGSNRLVGTDGADAIRSLGGSYDRMTGGEGADQFIFGTETSNGRRERDAIMDYEVGIDSIVLEAGTPVASIRETSSQVVVFLDGDRDAIYVRGEGVTADNLTIVTDDMFQFV